MSATIRRVARPRGVLTPGTLVALGKARKALSDAERRYRLTVLRALDEGSFAEVSRATGLSTNTLQRWKREASK